MPAKEGKRANAKSEDKSRRKRERKAKEPKKEKKKEKEIAVALAAVQPRAAAPRVAAAASAIDPRRQPGAELEGRVRRLSRRSSCSSPPSSRSRAASPSSSPMPCPSSSGRGRRDRGGGGSGGYSSSGKKRRKRAPQPAAQPAAALWQQAFYAQQQHLAAYAMYCQQSLWMMQCSAATQQLPSQLPPGLPPTPPLQPLGRTGVPEGSGCSGSSGEASGKHEMRAPASTDVEQNALAAAAAPAASATAAAGAVIAPASAASIEEAPARPRKRKSRWGPEVLPLSEVLARTSASHRDAAQPSTAAGTSLVSRVIADIAAKEATGGPVESSASLGARLMASASTSLTAKKAKEPAPLKLVSGMWEELRESTGLKLLSELCRDPTVAARWTYPLHDEQRRSFVGFLPGVVSASRSKAFFEDVKSGTNWVQPTGPLGPMPRKTAWLVAPRCACTYRYGGVAVSPQEYPAWMIKIMQEVMPYCGITESRDLPNGCNLNLYEDGANSVGWHADNEQLFQGAFRDCRVISLSLGATRSFELRLNWPEEGDRQPPRLQLSDGDICTMEGMLQKHFQHRVPREGHVAGARVNLTWRWIVKHSPRCPAGRSRPADAP